MTRRLLALAGAATLLALSGCASTVHLDAADRADDPLCAEVSVRLPQALGDLSRRWTDAQATGAWGDPTAVILTCGLEPPAPTTEQCVSIDGVDWIVDDADYPNLRMTTYGREPAAQAYVDTTVVSGDAALAALAPAVAQLPQKAACTDPDVAPDDTAE